MTDISGRISRVDLYMGIARLMAARSTCLRGQVGCVAVRNNHLVAAGYNGAPPDMDHCLDVGCGGGVTRVRDLHSGLVSTGSMSPMSKEGVDFEVLPEEFPNGCTRSIHAEQNMVAHAARIGVSLDGCTVYSTSGPCLPCAQALISAGMRHLVYETPYRLPFGLELIDKANILVQKYV